MKPTVQSLYDMPFYNMDQDTIVMLRRSYFVTTEFYKVRSGSVVECLTRDRRATGSSLKSVTALCPLARHINHCLVLVKPRKTCSDITEKLLTGT